MVVVAVQVWMYARGWAVRTFPIRTVEQVWKLTRFSVDPVRARRPSMKPSLHKGGALDASWEYWLG